MNWQAWIVLAVLFVLWTVHAYRIGHAFGYLKCWTEERDKDFIDVGKKSPQPNTQSKETT